MVSRQSNLGLVAGKEYVGYAILAQVGASTPPMEIRLAWGDNPDEGRSVILDHVGRAYRKVSFRFRSGATTESASLAPEPSDKGSEGQTTETCWTGSNVPPDS